MKQLRSFALTTFCGPCGLGLKMVEVKKMIMGFNHQKWGQAAGEYKVINGGWLMLGSWDPCGFHMIPIIFDIGIILWHLWMHTNKYKYI